MKAQCSIWAIVTIAVTVLQPVPIALERKQSWKSLGKEYLSSCNKSTPA